MCETMLCPLFAEFHSRMSRFKLNKQKGVRREGIKLRQKNLHPKMNRNDVLILVLVWKKGNILEISLDKTPNLFPAIRSHKLTTEM